MGVETDRIPMIDVQLGFQLNHAALSAQQLRTLAMRLAGELTELDPDKDNAFDPAVHTSPGECLIVVDLVIPSGRDALECASHALKVIRTAAQAAELGPLADMLVPTRIQACPIPVPMEITQQVLAKLGFAFTEEHLADARSEFIAGTARHRLARMPCA